jgi:outer membrane protein assembly factor BamE
MRFAILLAVAFLASACVYRIDIQQGNYIGEDLAAKVKPGMTRSEVRQILGTPLLTDAFHANRWDYYFSHERGRAAEKPTRFSVVFENDKVVSTSGEARAALPTPVLPEQETRPVRASPAPPPPPPKK